MISGLLNAIGKLVVDAVNALIAVLGASAAAAISLLPDMPAIPSLPGPFSTAAAWVAWFFPVGTVLDVLAFVLAMYLLWYVVSIGLRWAKALND